MNCKRVSLQSSSIKPSWSIHIKARHWHVDVKIFNQSYAIVKRFKLFTRKTNEVLHAAPRRDLISHFISSQNSSLKFTYMLRDT